MRLAIVTNVISPSRGGRRYGGRYVEDTDALKEAYCGRHRIDYLRTSDDPRPQQRPEWAKPVLMSRVLSSGYDWAVWMDADAAPVNLEFDLSGFLSGHPGKVVIQQVGEEFNSGVFAVPATPEAAGWLEYVDSQREVPEYQSGHVEQLAIDASLRGRWPHLAYEPPFEVGWNHRIRHFMASPAAGYWCLHLPGTADAERDLTFRTVRDRVMAGLPPFGGPNLP